MKGYNLLAQTLHDEAVAHGATFRLNTVVEEVQWKPNRVEVTTRSQNRVSQFKSSRALITLPLALLQANETELVRFLPQLRNKQEAARKLSMGQVAKIILQFRQPFWEDVRLPTRNGSSDDLKEFAFIHAPDEMVPTWWTQLPLRVPLLVGWAGGPRAEALSLGGEQYLLDQSLRALSRILGISRKSIEALLEAFYTHNWGTDPFSCGAYSYLPVGGLKAQGQLAQSVENTLFFAGEATNTEGHHATVHGAIASGSRAAKEIIGGTLAT